jgi:hypothetical protein
VLGPRGSATFISHLPVDRVRGVKCVQWPLAPSKKHRMDPPRIPARTLQGSTGRSDSPMLGESERSMDPSRVLMGTLGGFKRRPLEGASGHLTFVDSERGPLEGSSGYPWRVQAATRPLEGPSGDAWRVQAGTLGGCKRPPRGRLHPERVPAWNPPSNGHFRNTV